MILDKLLEEPIEEDEDRVKRIEEKKKQQEIEDKIFLETQKNLV